MKKIAASLIACSLITACGKSPDQPQQTQSGAQSSQPQQSASDPRNLAPQVSSPEQLAEARYKMQMAVKSMSDADKIMYDIVKHNAYGAGGDSGVNRKLNVEQPYTLSEQDVQKWLAALPPSISGPINEKLKDASPATASQIISSAFYKSWKDISTKYSAGETLCYITRRIPEIGFDGQNYIFPVGMFDSSVIVHNGKYLNKTPAHLVSDAEYKKINSLVSDQNNVMRICWKNKEGYFYTPQQIKEGRQGVVHDPYFKVELAGTYDIINTSNGSVVYSFNNDWFFY